MVVAALYVETDGTYFNLPHVDPWDSRRNALLYDGPFPVVAHPPCGNWGRYWGISDNDGGLFEAALTAVRTWGGVLEHPADSRAWKAFKIPKPKPSGKWLATPCGGYTCCVEQGHYGHPARKRTWLYVHGFKPPELRWGKSRPSGMPDLTGLPPGEQKRLIRMGVVQRLSKRQRTRTPDEFRDLLLSLARMVY